MLLDNADYEPETLGVMQEQQEKRIAEQGNECEQQVMDFPKEEDDNGHFLPPISPTRQGNYNKVAFEIPEDNEKDENSYSPPISDGDGDGDDDHDGFRNAHYNQPASPQSKLYGQA